jgi:CheY-like chemotaxis protein
VCHGIVQRHHGSIDIDSTPGQGTTFRINLPFSHERVGDRDGAPAASLDRWRILFIDDDPRVRPVVARMLQELDQVVDLANAGSAGLTLFREKSYDLVMTDLGMPRMDGYEVTQIIKTIRPDVPVILVTGWRGAGDLEVAPTGHTPDLVLEKPVTLASLRDALIRVQTRLRG